MSELQFLLNPSYEFILPSGKKIEVKGMDGYCEDLLANRKRALKEGDTIEILLTRCIVKLEGIETTITKNDVLNMWSADRTFTLLLIRQLSLGNNIDVKLTCGNCGKSNSFLIDIKEDIIDKVKIQKEVPDYKDVIIENTKFRIKQSNGEHERLIIERTNADNQACNITHTIMVLCEGWWSEEKQKFVPLTKDQVQKMPARIQQPLRKAIESIKFGPDITVEGYCSKCNSKLLGTIFDSDFFTFDK